MDRETIKEVEIIMTKEEIEALPVGRVIERVAQKSRIVISKPRKNTVCITCDKDFKGGKMTVFHDGCTRWAPIVECIGCYVDNLDIERSFERKIITTIRR